jgi:periplasmic divalent cation tolerance protein
MNSETLLVLCNCPDREVALDMANHLVQQGLAACVNISGPVTSIYRWKGSLETAQETTLLIKTTQERYTDLEREIVTRHPYELPEIIAVPVERGLSGYLDWVKECTTSGS